MINTVQENRIGFTNRQIKGAKEAKDLYEKIGYPSLNNYIKMVR